jgi:cyclic AMP-dependent transcription factor ATF-2
VARATYLRKNRNAASKCRNKQKKEQDDLVEAARDAERTNKVLKAKVAILNDDLQELMLLVEQHCQCPDSRLRLYAERIGRIPPNNVGATYQS